jgi:hypothetical protein
VYVPAFKGVILRIPLADGTAYGNQVTLVGAAVMVGVFVYGLVIFREMFVCVHATTFCVFGVRVHVGIETN